MKINGVESGVILTSLVEHLYAKVVNRTAKFPLPIKVIDSPELVKSILMAPDVFVKNYGFIENLSKGRFSANGHDWKARASITQSFYSQATNLLDEDVIEDIYLQHLRAFSDQADGNLYETFVAAALEVVSKTFHLETAIPWPPVLVNRARDCLMDQQAMAWEQVQPEVFEQSQKALSDIYNAFNVLWASDSDLTALLERFSDQALGIENFSATGEMLQNLFASTETTASSMLWILECITRHADYQAVLKVDDDALDYFIDEALRLFPPVPFVTRVCNNATEIDGVAFAQDEPMIISIIGVHSDPSQWKDPLTFMIKRPEFVDASYARHAYIPFLSGPRTCAGMKLAKQEVKSGVRAILKLFTISPCIEPRKLEYGISSRPGVGLSPYLMKIVTGNS